MFQHFSRKSFRDISRNSNQEFIRNYYPKDLSRRFPQIVTPSIYSGFFLCVSLSIFLMIPSEFPWNSSRDSFEISSGITRFFSSEIRPWTCTGMPPRIHLGIYPDFFSVIVFVYPWILSPPRDSFIKNIENVWILMGGFSCFSWILSVFFFDVSPLILPGIVPVISPRITLEAFSRDSFRHFCYNFSWNVPELLPKRFIPGFFLKLFPIFFPIPCWSKIAKLLNDSKNSCYWLH